MGLSWTETLAADRRLKILMLIRDNGGSANEEVLRTALGQLGHRRGVTRDTVRADLDILRGHNLVRHEWLEQLLVAHLQERGLDVVHGDVDVDGVAPPKIAG